MNRYIVQFAAIAGTLAAVSCSNDPSGTGAVHPDTTDKWSIGTYTGATRAVIGAAEDGFRAIEWGQSDALTVFNASMKSDFTLSSGIGEATAIFESEDAALQNSSDYYAVHTKLGTTFSAGTGLTVTMPSPMRIEGTPDEFVSDHIVLLSDAFHFSNRAVNGVTVGMRNAVLELHLGLGEGDTDKTIHTLEVAGPTADYFVTKAVYDGAGNVEYTAAPSLQIEFATPLTLSAGIETSVKLVVWMNPEVTAAAVEGKEMVFYFLDGNDMRVVEMRKPAVLLEGGQYYNAPSSIPAPRRVKFVKVDGTGTGSSWDDAMSPDALSAALKELNIPTDAPDILAPEDTVCMAAGTYILDKAFSNTETRIVKSLVVIGGFPENVTGDGVEIEYPSEHRTIISGDRNGNGIPNSGDVRALTARNAGTVVTLKGIDMSCGYGAGGGFSVETGAITKMYWCRVYGNLSESGNFGGGIYITGSGTLYCYRTEIFDNLGPSRGGGIQVSGGKLYMESSLVKDNEITGSFGSAIHATGSNNTVIVANSTITGNSANAGGAVNMSNDTGTGIMAFISSTIAGNTQNTNPNNDGTEFRCENPNLKFINCIVANSDAAKYTINTQGNGNAVLAGGNVVTGTIGTGAGSDGEFSLSPSDVTGKTFADIFGTNTLADNGGYPQTLMPASMFTGSSQAELTTFFATYVSGAPFEFDLSVDQRGTARNATAATPGACEK